MATTEMVLAEDIGAVFITELIVIISQMDNMKPNKETKPKSLEVKLSKVYKSTELNEIKLKTYLATVKSTKS